MTSTRGWSEPPVPILITWSCLYIKLKLGRDLHLGPSWHGPSFAYWAELAWAEFYVGRVGRGRVGLGPSCPAPRGTGVFWLVGLWLIYDVTPVKPECVRCCFVKPMLNISSSGCFSNSLFIFHALQRTPPFFPNI